MIERKWVPTWPRRRRCCDVKIIPHLAACKTQHPHGYGTWIPKTPHCGRMSHYGKKQGSNLAHCSVLCLMQPGTSLVVTVVRLVSPDGSSFDVVVHTAHKLVSVVPCQYKLVLQGNSQATPVHYLLYPEDTHSLCCCSHHP